MPNSPSPQGGGARARMQRWLPKLVLSPSFVLILFFVYGFILWTTYISFSNSGMLPDYSWAGLRQWSRLWNSWTWGIALHNIWIFGLLYIVSCIVLGLLLAILLDQRIRAEGALRTIYLYPMALSFIVTGTAWQWFLNPGLGLEKTMHELGWQSFSFNWLIDSGMAIYTIVIAAVWQATGFIMAMFLAGLRGIDGEMIKAAQIDGAPAWKIYLRIIIPQLRPVFLSAVVVLAHLAIKSFDLIVAMTGGGPGNSTAVPATFMYSYAFSRNEMGIAAASAVFMLAVIAALIIPYLYSELRESRS
ncbi:carbohydrate ABC transporter membrane protein 1 (CUT1 family) [Kushneria sinocarnis]|uniref:Carbohydrate ABC transporter membrane protein 1 (CUT1 family) n=1 Tax=Kushneria sinocarnis TaxID=595502 RepID=A0A420X0V7_9GAMM|nr:sugar ABC transporter permease [Kushneria sinocarnis]RKR07483.1 carbohydrate ABC transporter membrane protein 1 (CUT1 family) [Kushneria sinocarnis]